MNDRERTRQSRSMGLNIGSSSIIMLFAVLCLTVLSALSLLSANSQLRLSERAANVVSSYYSADFAAASIFDRILNGDPDALNDADTSNRAELDSGGWEITYTVNLDELQSLEVVYHDIDGVIELQSWRLVEAGLWEPDESLFIWTGN